MIYVPRIKIIYLKNLNKEEKIIIEWLYITKTTPTKLNSKLNKMYLLREDIIVCG